MKTQKLFVCQFFKTKQKKANTSVYLLHAVRLKVTLQTGVLKRFCVWFLSALVQGSSITRRTSIGTKVQPNRLKMKQLAECL